MVKVECHCVRHLDYMHLGVFHDMMIVALNSRDNIVFSFPNLVWKGIPAPLCLLYFEMKCYDKNASHLFIEKKSIELIN